MSTSRKMAITVIMALLAGCSGNEQHGGSATRAECDSANNAVMPEVILIALSDTADPVTDFLQAVSTGDLRFAAVSGYATEIPGVPDYYERYRKSNGIMIIVGTGDTWTDTADMRRDIFFRQYAKSYNTLLLKHLSRKVSRQ